jgi:hypothetical protein
MSRQETRYARSGEQITRLVRSLQEEAASPPGGQNKR